MTKKINRKCRICKKVFNPKRLNEYWCTPDHAIEYLRLQKEKDQRSLKVKQEINKKLYPAIAKQSKTSYTGRLNYARKIFQKWIRQRDVNEGCISCGSTSAKYYDGGHYFKAEIYPNLIFNQDNVHKQCRKCNRYLNGNEAAYTIGLIQKIGMERFEQLQKSASKSAHKYDECELKRIRKEYK